MQTELGRNQCPLRLRVASVIAFEAHTGTDLDYPRKQVGYEKEGCKFGALRNQSHVSIAYPDDATEQAIAQQRRADNGEAAWVLRDPQRVAVESLRLLYRGQVPVLRSVKKTAARQVFRWKNGKNQVVGCFWRNH